MSGKEFDDYLKSIGGLVNGFYTDRENIVSSHFFDIQNGWYELVKNLIDDLITLGWNKELCQVKEKFGGLRFYINEGSVEIFNRIDKAESESLSICEICGEPGILRTDRHWIKTLCNKHNI